MRAVMAGGERGLAEIVAVKNGVALTQKKEGSAMPQAAGVCGRA